MLALSRTGARRREAAVDEVMPDWPVSDDNGSVDPDFDDDGEGWLPDWLPGHRRDNSLDDWI